jgi:hypothetical protein
MEDSKKAPLGGAKASGRLTDAVAKWEGEAGHAPPALAEIRLDGNEHLLIPFCTEVGEAVTHYLDYPSLRGYVRCNGEGCLLCRVGRQTELRDLLPVYDVIGGAVGVLPVSPNLRPHALRPQLTPVLRRLKANERVLLAVRKIDRTRYNVTTLPLPDDADDGADKILEFLEQFGAGAIDLGAIYQKLTDEELADVPEIATTLKVRGITP